MYVDILSRINPIPHTNTLSLTHTPALTRTRKHTHRGPGILSSCATGPEEAFIHDESLKVLGLVTYDMMANLLGCLIARTHNADVNVKVSP